MISFALENLIVSRINYSGHLCCFSQQFIVSYHFVSDGKAFLIFV